MLHQHLKYLQLVHLIIPLLQALVQLQVLPKVLLVFLLLKVSIVLLLVIPIHCCTLGYNCASITAIPIAVSVSVTFILTALLSSILTLILTLLCVRNRSNKPVKQVRQDEGGTAAAAVAVYDEITTNKGQATSPVPLTSNPAYGPLNY